LPSAGHISGTFFGAVAGFSRTKARIGHHEVMRPDFTPSRELYPFTSRWFEASSGRVHYVDEGTGPPILLLHGNPTWSFLYRHLIRRLSASFRCVAIDYLGFGLSDRPVGYGYTPSEHSTVVGELVDELELDQLIVMGHDWGGPIGATMAAARSKRIAGLVWGNTSFWPPNRPFRVFSAAASTRPLRWAILNRNVLVERVLPLRMRRDLSDDEMEHYRAVQPTPASRIGVAEFPRQMVAATPWFEQLSRDVPEKLGSVRTLITWPMRDFEYPPSFLARLQSMFSDVHTIKLSAAGHFPQEDAPDEIAQAIRARFS
jgi:haloalkane dehalogenase